MISIRMAALAVAISATIPATTLEKLTLDDMAAKSTDIVRGRVQSVSASRRGSVIYTVARLQVIERFKGSAAGTVDVWVPGGSLDGARQSFSGAPVLAPGTEYMFFLWRGQSGSAQIIGFSQGLFNLKLDANGRPLAVRGAIQETMLDPGAHRAVRDDGFAMSLADLRDFLKRRLGAAKE